eukprot:COSAG05_NODE_24088_length_258_cov_0.503226_1_plen_57_part_00
MRCRACEKGGLQLWLLWMVVLRGGGWRLWPIPGGSGKGLGRLGTGVKKLGDFFFLA